MKIKIDNFSIVWVTRVSESENIMLKHFFDHHDSIYDYEKIVVGHTNLDFKKYNFKYIPLWENGLDEMSLLGLKKNLGVFNSTKEYCLVLHSDTFPTNKLFENVKNISLSDIDVVAPIGFLIDCNKNIGIHRTATWVEQCSENDINYNKWRENNMLFWTGGRHKLTDEPMNEFTYISGAAIFSKTSTFRKIKWNNDLGRGQEEDVEYSQRLKQNNYKLSCNPLLEVYMYNSQ